jgi:DnaK suppressor protein
VVAKAPEPAKPAKAKAPAAPVFVPKPVKPVKGPPINSDDPFEGIDDLTEGQFMWQQIELLKSERDHYMSQAAMLRAEADQLAVDMEPGDVQFDDESGEGATTNVERERDLAMSASAIGLAEEIERLLLTIENGAYGYCESCHKAIVRDRLRAMPAATLCVACKSGGLSRR